jgi:hypothetical protein
MDVVLTYRPFVPFRRFHARDERFALMVCTRRAGKTVAVVNDMVIRALRTKLPDARYGYFAPSLKQGIRAAWDEFKKAVEPLGNRVKINETAKTITLPNNARIELYSGEDPHSIRGGRWDGAVLDEYGDMKSILWTQVVRKGLADRKGWAVFIGTPRGKNSFYKLRERARTWIRKPDGDNWFYLSLTAEEIVNHGGPKTGWGIWTRQELDSTREDAADEDEFRQEHMCDFEATNRGSYYGKHVSALDAREQIKYDTDDHPLYDRTYPVSIAHDPGFNDAWAIWFWQLIDGQVRFIDYWEETGYDASEVIDMLELKPYRYDTWWVPHDALHQTAQSRQSIIDQFRAADAPARKVPNPDAGNRVHHGVTAVRRALRVNPFVFDGKKCARGLESLRNYSRKWDQDAQVFSEKAKHDQYSHGADAFRYACLSITPEAIKESAEQARRKKAEPEKLEGVPTLNRTYGESVDMLAARVAARNTGFRDRI